MLNKSLAREVINIASSTGADFVEIFNEDTIRKSYVLEGMKVDATTVATTSGVGLRLLKGTRSVYGSTSDKSKKALLALAETLSKSFNDERVLSELDRFSDVKVKSIHKKSTPISSINPAEIVSLLKKVNSIILGFDKRIVRAISSFALTKSEIEIFNSTGKHWVDHKEYGRLGIQSIASEDGKIETRFDGPGAQGGWEYFTNELNVEEIAAGLRRDNVPNRSGAPAWSSTGIRYILSNEKYLGDSHWQKYYTTTSLPFQSKVNHGEVDSYYVRGTHRGIITPEEFRAANLLMKQRRQKIMPHSFHARPFKQRIFCGICNSVFRRKAMDGDIYWVCIGRDKKRTIGCPITPILEIEIERAFFRLYNNLRHQGMPILHQLLADLQSARKGKLLWSLDIVALNQKIADITRQDRLLAQLKQQGLVDPDIFISRQNELAEQLRTAKLEKERFLEAGEDQTIQQTQELIEALEAGPDFLETFDGELFRELVDKIIVESNDRLRFRLVNGLELTESMERTVR